MRRRKVIEVAAGLLAVLPALHAQQPASTVRIGFLGAASSVSSSTRFDALRAGLRELGYVEGRNLIIEQRWADDRYERLPELAGELVRLKVDIIITAGAPGARAAKAATSSIPIVIAITGDAISSGLVSSLAQPGGNITGSTYFIQDLYAKRVEILKESFPALGLLAVLRNPRNPAHAVNLQKMEAAARSLKINLLYVDATGPEEFAAAFASMSGKGVAAVQVLEDPMLNGQVDRTEALAAKHRLPSVGSNEFAQAGGLIGYGVNIVAFYRRAPYFIDRIVKGARPADLPVEQAARFDLILNMRTARSLGLSIPQLTLLRASEVIE